MSKTIKGVIYSDDFKTVWGTNDCWSEIELNENVKTIMPRAFKDCKNLKKVVLPKSLRSIGDEAFSGCIMLESCDVPNSVNKLGEKTFYNCIGLKDIRISNRIERLEKSTFEGCKNLKNFIIPDYVMEIEEECFKDCYSLQSLYFPDDINFIGKRAFSNCTGLEEIELNDGLQFINEGAFKKTGLFKIRIPESVCMIGDDAFANSKLQRLDWETKVRFNKEKLKNIFYGTNITTVYKNNCEIDFDNFINSIDDIIEKNNVKDNNTDKITYRDFDLDLLK